MLFSQSDLEALLDPFVTDSEVTYKKGTEFERSFPAVFDNGFKRYGDELELSGFFPFLTCASTDAEGIENGDLITVGDVVYKVRDVQPDGEGFTIIEVKK